MNTRFARLAFALWFGCGLLLFPHAARADEDKEYLVKAGFVYNFVKFVEWPDGKAIASQSHIDICILGESPLSKQADVFKLNSTDKLSMALVSEKSARSASAHCHILFIAPDRAGSLPEIIAGLKNQPVLTVSDMNDFADNGGMIGFVLVDNKIKLAINTKAAKAAGLHVDPQLLEVAIKVIDR